MISRRDALQLLSAAGIGCVLPGAARAEETPRRGGRIRVAGYSSSNADTLDPAKQAWASDYVRGSMFYNGLTSLDERLEPQPALAERIEHDRLTVWTVTLRSDVLFHDGSPLTAADVVYSLRRHRDPAIGSKARALANQMEEIKATGPREVTIRLSGPNADFPAILGTFHFYIIKDGTTDFSRANGTGPFKCREFLPGVRSVAERFDDYWRSPGAWLDEIEFFGIADDTARVNALLSGDVDLIETLNPRLARLIRSQGFSVFESKSGGYTDLYMRLDQGPGRDPDFVLGMKYLLDRELMKTAIFRGYAELGNDHPIAPSNRFFASDIPQRAFDPDRAKFHLGKSGHLGGHLPMVASTAAEASVEMAMLMQESAAAIGLTLDVQRMPADGYWSNSWMKAPIGFGNVNARPSADILFTLFFQSNAPWNESGWKNPTFDRLLGEARTEADEGRRRDLYREMQLLVRDQAGIGIPLFLSTLDAHTPKLKGLRPMPTGGLMGFCFAEHVWLEG